LECESKNFNYTLIGKNGSKLLYKKKHGVLHKKDEELLKRGP
jgi:hypothetical protein